MSDHEWDTPKIRRAMQALAMLAETDTEMRNFYEGRLRALRDERARLADAEAQGFRMGVLMGRIIAVQRFMGQEPTPVEVLEAMRMEDLERLAEELEGLSPR